MSISPRRMHARGPHILGARVYGVGAMSDAHLFAVGVVLAWLAGIRAYLTVFGVGIAGYLGWLDLPQALEPTASPWVIGVCGALAAIEFFADKIPGVDSAWDLLNTLARVPAGAFPAAATLSPDGDLGTGAMLTGAAVALGSHVLKAGSRAVINTSPSHSATGSPRPARTSPSLAAWPCCWHTHGSPLAWPCW